MKSKNDVFRKGRRLFATINGRTQSLSDWAREGGLPYGQVWARIHRHGWSIDRAVSEPLQEQLPRFHGTADMVRRTGCSCQDCNQWRKLAKSSLVRNDQFVPSKPPHSDDEGRWFDKGRQRFILYKRQKLNIRQWAEKLGFVEITLRRRLIDLKMPVREAFNREVSPYGRGIVHGTKTAYDYWKCRCVECKAANAAYARSYYASTQESKS